MCHVIPPLLCTLKVTYFFISLSQGLQQSRVEGGSPDDPGMYAAGQPGLYCLHGVQPEAADPHPAEELREDGETADSLISG